MAQALVEQRVELRREGPDVPLGDASVAAAKRSMEARWTDEQKKHVAGLKERANKKMWKVAEDAAPHSEACRRSSSGVACAPLGRDLGAACARPRV